ncbi:MAG: TPM domain-containing protein [Cyanobacteria bacterium J06632_22]
MKLGRLKQWIWPWVPITMVRGTGLAIATLLIVISLNTFVPNQSKIQVLNGAGLIDRAEAVSASNQAELNQIVASLNATTGAQIIVVTMPDIGTASTVMAYADELFDAWEMGRINIENGVLLLVVTNDRTAAIRAGNGILAVLSDAQLQTILDDRVMPQLRDGNVDRGILRGTVALASALDGKTFTPSVFSRQRYRRWSRWPLYYVWRGSYWIGRAIFNPVWVATGVIVGSISALLTYFHHSKVQALHIQPTGVSDVTGLVATGNLIPGLGWLIDTVISLGLQHQPELAPPRQLAGQGMLIDYSRAMQKSICLTFGLLLGISLVTLLYLCRSLGNGLGLSAWIALVLGLAASEFWWQTRQPQHASKKAKPAQHSAASAFLQSFVVGFGLNIPLVVVSGGFSLLTVPFVLAAWTGTCALVPRLHRLYWGGTAVRCQRCNSEMKQLYGRHFENSIDGERQTWHCATCFPDSPPASETFHVFLKRRGKPQE